MSRKIILASASPRRQDILHAAGYTFDIKPTDSSEDCDFTSPCDVVMELARRKALACKESLDEEIINSPDGYLIIGADTLVFLDDSRLGKPGSVEEWRNCIKRLSGNTHSVYTGVCLIYDNQLKIFSSETKVSVASMSRDDIDSFISRGEDMDKAGGYAIQGYFSKYIPHIEGEYNNVVGFPIAKFREVLDEIGLDL